jgi:hypothetical protein
MRAALYIACLHANHFVRTGVPELGRIAKCCTDPEPSLVRIAIISQFSDSSDQGSSPIGVGRAKIVRLDWRRGYIYNATQNEGGPTAPVGCKLNFAYALIIGDCV